jgi:signal peptidase I
MVAALQNADTSRDRRPRFEIESVIIFAYWLVGSYLITMVLWVAIPTVLLGWHPTVIASGSMRPLIQPGDVLLFDRRTDPVGTGTVIVFRQNDLIVHRVLETDGQGGYITKGDANRLPDSTPVTKEQFVGRGRLLVPYLGLSRVLGWIWWLALVVILLASTFVWRRVTRLAAALVAIGLVAASVGSSIAAFATTSASNSSSFVAVDPAPPTDLIAECGLVGVGNVNVDLSWTPSTSRRDGYRILYDDPSAGVNFVEVGTTGPATTSFTHQIPATTVNTGTHTYEVEAFVGSWLSEPSNTDAVTVSQVIVAYTCTNL